jgi:hypothetical protein
MPGGDQSAEDGLPDLVSDGLMNAASLHSNDLEGISQKLCHRFRPRSDTAATNPVTEYHPVLGYTK